jgi:predicted acylesterase/phospholipase RssA
MLQTQHLSLPHYLTWYLLSDSNLRFKWQIITRGKLSVPYIYWWIIGGYKRNDKMSFEELLNKTKEDDDFPFNGMCFEGGGVLGISYYGALDEQRKTYTEKYLDHIVNFSGASVGAIAATILACRGSHAQIKEFVGDLNIKSLADWSYNPITMVYRMFWKLGICAGDKLCAFYEHLVKTLTGSESTTFKEAFAKFGTNLVIPGTNAETRETSYFHHKTTPNMPIVMALRITTSIPLLFTAVQHEGSIWVDGGLLDNYPLNIFDNKRFTDTPGNTLGFKVVTRSDLKKKTKITGIVSLCTSLFNAVYQQALEEHADRNDYKQTLKIFTGGVSSTDFDISPGTKELLIRAGVEGAKRFVIKWDLLH